MSRAQLSYASVECSTYMPPTKFPPPVNMPLPLNHEDNSGGDSDIIIVAHWILSPVNEVSGNPEVGRTSPFTLGFTTTNRKRTIPFEPISQAKAD